MLRAQRLHSLLDKTMREETRQLDNLKVLSEGLTLVTGTPFPEAVEMLRWVQSYVRACVKAGYDNDLLIALERSALGDLGEALIELARR
jgi:hypothetical protein